MSSCRDDTHSRQVATAHSQIGHRGTLSVVDMFIVNVWIYCVPSTSVHLHDCLAMSMCAVRASGYTQEFL